MAYSILCKCIFSFHCLSRIYGNCIWLPAGLVRAAGGWLADKVGARIVLLWVFGVCLVCMVFVFVPRMEIQAPGQGVMANKPGVVSSVSDNEIVVGDDTYFCKARVAIHQRLQFVLVFIMIRKAFYFFPLLHFIRHQM